MFGIEIKRNIIMPARHTVITELWGQQNNVADSRRGFVRVAAGRESIRAEGLETLCNIIARIPVASSNLLKGFN